MQVRTGNYYTPANTRTVVVGDEFVTVRKPKKKKQEVYCFVDGKKMYRLSYVAMNEEHAKEVLAVKHPNQKVTFKLA